MKIALAVNPICSCFCAIKLMPQTSPSHHLTNVAPKPKAVVTLTVYVAVVVVVVAVVYVDFVSSEILA